MLTPQEIQDQKFEKAVFGGYDMGQIDNFLDQVLNDYTSLYKENAALKTKMRVLVDKIEEYRAVEDEFRKTLYNAQVAAKDTISRAETEAQRLVSEARMNAKTEIADLQKEIDREALRLENAKRSNMAYADKIRRAMELGMKQMEEILGQSEPAPAPAPAPVKPAPAPAPEKAQPVAPAPETVARQASEAEAIYEQVIQAIQRDAVPAPAPAPAEPQPAEEPRPEPVQETVVALEPDLTVEAPAPAPALQSDPESDTARIYGDSPFTPKPRFNFTDMRFGKQYDKDHDEN